MPILLRSTSVCNLPSVPNGAVDCTSWYASLDRSAVPVGTLQIATPSSVDEPSETLPVEVADPPKPKSRRGAKSFKKARSRVRAELASPKTRESVPTVQRDARGRLLPGQVLNPAGRPKGVSELIDSLVGPLGAGCFEFLADVLKGRINATARDRIDSARILLDRRLGRAPETHIVAAVPSEVAEAMAALSREELLALATGRPLPELPAATQIVDAEIVEPTDMESVAPSDKPEETKALAEDPESGVP